MKTGSGNITIYPSNQINKNTAIYAAFKQVYMLEQFNNASVPSRNARGYVLSHNMQLQFKTANTDYLAQFINQFIQSLKHNPDNSDLQFNQVQPLHENQKNLSTSQQLQEIEINLLRDNIQNGRAAKDGKVDSEAVKICQDAEDHLRDNSEKEHLRGLAQELGVIAYFSAPASEQQKRHTQEQIDKSKQASANEHEASADNQKEIIAKSQNLIDKSHQMNEKR